MVCRWDFEFGDWSVGHHGLFAVKGEAESSLSLPPRPFLDEEDEAVKGFPDSDDEREQEQVQEAIQSNAYGPISLEKRSPRRVPVDPGLEIVQTPIQESVLGPGAASSSSLTMDVDSTGQAASKHKAEAQGGSESKALKKFDDDPVPQPKVKGAKTNVRRIGEIESRT